MTINMFGHVTTILDHKYSHFLGPWAQSFDLKFPSLNPFLVGFTIPYNGICLTRNFESEFGYTPHNPREFYQAKPKCIKALYDKTPLENIIWADVDSVLANDIDIFGTEYDLALYARRKKNGKIKLKAGFMCFKRSDRTAAFLTEWVQAMDTDIRGDQQWLNQFFSKHRDPYSDFRPGTTEIDKLKVLILGDEYYKEIYEPEDLNTDAAVLHFMGHKKDETGLKLAHKLELLREWQKLQSSQQPQTKNT